MINIYNIEKEIAGMTYEEMRLRLSLINSEIKILEYEEQSLKDQFDKNLKHMEDVKKTAEKYKVCPLLIANVAEVDVKEEDTFDEGDTNLNKQTKGRNIIIKTSTRETICLENRGLLDDEELTPGDFVAVNKDSFVLVEKIPSEIDPRVKVMEIDEKPTEQYSDIGGLDKQIQELMEAIVLPITHKDKFEAIGITPPKGAIMYGPPGTGKTLLARACAAQTNATFMKLAGPQLVQKYIGDGAKIIRDAFQLAKQKAPTIIFIDELDAIGTKRFDSEKSGDREVQRTMLELLNQLDGFQSSDGIKIVAATNRIDILDPALLRSGRIDRKIEFPAPNEEARAKIMQIHSRKMAVSKNVNFEELSRSMEDFNGAQCKAVCVEAGMITLRRNGNEVSHDDFMDAILEVQYKKKTQLTYYA